VVDYEKEDFRASGERYDVVFDAVGLQSFLRCRRSVAPDGVYITTDPGLLWHDALVSLLASRAKLGIVRYRKEDLLVLAEMLERGEYRAVIDRTYPLENVVEAHRYVDTHRKTGSVVVTTG
jgi:NADPH:quinone reductase-like Zn-dependent oxidoreductase